MIIETPEEVAALFLRDTRNVNQLADRIRRRDQARDEALGELWFSVAIDGLPQGEGPFMVVYQERVQHQTWFFHGDQWATDPELHETTITAGLDEFTHYRPIPRPPTRRT